MVKKPLEASESEDVSGSMVAITPAATAGTMTMITGSGMRQGPEHIPGLGRRTREAATLAIFPAPGGAEAAAAEAAAAAAAAAAWRHGILPPGRPAALTAAEAKAGGRVTTVTQDVAAPSPCLFSPHQHLPALKVARICKDGLR